MNESRLASYVWLRSKLDDLAICGPEHAENGALTRVQWAERGGCDMLPGGGRLRRHHADDEDHPPGRGLRHAHGGAQRRPGQHARAVRDGQSTASTTSAGWCTRCATSRSPFKWQKSHYDPLDADGYVHVPERPGLGDDIDFDYIKANEVRSAIEVGP